MIDLKSCDYDQLKTLIKNEKAGFEDEKENCFQAGECRESFHVQGSYLTDEFAW